MEVPFSIKATHKPTVMSFKLLCCHEWQGFCLLYPEIKVPLILDDPKPKVSYIKLLLPEIYSSNP